MPHLLSRQGRAALRDVVVSRRWLLVLDYDGTLAPIVEDPARARLRPETRCLLDAVARRGPCAVLSGRAVSDLAPFLEGIPLECLIGNHGAEWQWRWDRGGFAPPRSPLVEDWRRVLVDRLPGIDGAVLEHKGLSLTVHYRRARSPTAAERAIRAAVADLPRVRVIGGLRVVNLLPDVAPDKGVALGRLLRRLASDAAIYVGDDDTDEDAFRLVRPGLVTARVGARSPTRAEFYLRRQAEIDDLLAVLLALAERDRRPLPLV